MAVYNVLSRPLMQRSSALGFLAVGMGFPPQWIAGVYLGVGGGALAFILWVLALQRATPTQVANTMTLNPIAAALLATQLVDEPITLNLVIGVIAVCLGIWIATTVAAKQGSG